MLGVCYGRKATRVTASATLSLTLAISCPIIRHAVSLRVKASAYQISGVLSRYGKSLSDNCRRPASTLVHASPEDSATSRDPQYLLERAKLKAERKRRRRKARLDRGTAVGRAKNIRWSGSATENAGLEALLPPEGPEGSGAPALSGLPDLGKAFTVLGIETSCDDTAAAVVRSDGAVLGEAVVGQAQIHEKWGGVVPGLARDSHELRMDEVVSKALEEAGMASADEVDAVAVTVGPGLEICLRVGCEKAKQLAIEHLKPFVAVHHLEAHTLLARKPFPATDPDQAEQGSDPDEPLNFPFLGLLVSGGHCQTLLCEGVGQYTILGGTIDDALGEGYDKAARLLGLNVGGGGGPALEALAAKGDAKRFTLPIPMQMRKDLDYSFAGLKSSFRMAVTRAVDDYRAASAHSGIDEVLLGGNEKREVNDLEPLTIANRGASLPESVRADLAAGYQHTAIVHVEERLRRTMDECEKIVAQNSSASTRGTPKREERDIRTLAVMGGVAANQELRRRLQLLCAERDPPWRIVVPPTRLCTDNGVMVAWAGIERLRMGMSNKAEDQEVYARLPLGQAYAETKDGEVADSCPDPVDITVVATA